MLDLEIYIIRWYSGDSKYTYETTILQVYYISAVVQSLSCVRLCKSMDCNRPGFPVLYNLLEFAQAHVHWGDDAIQPSHICRHLLLLSLIFLSIKVFSNEPTLHIRWPKYWSFSFCSSNEYSDWFPLGLTGLISLLSKGLSRVFFSTTVWKHQFFSVQPSFWPREYSLGPQIWANVGKNHPCFWE